MPRYDGYVNIVVKSGSGTAPYSFSINDGVSYSGRAIYDNQEEFDAVIRVKDSKGCVAGPVAAKVSNKSVPLTKFDLVSDGGKKQYCANADGVELMLTGSEQGTEYTLYKNGTATVPVQSGTGAAINFGIQKAGTYTVKALNPLTGCDAVMVGRAAQGNPFIFREINEYLINNILVEKPTPKLVYDTIMEHHKLLADLKGEYLACLEMRTHISQYLKGMPGSSQIKAKVNMEKNFEAVKQILENYLLGKEMKI